MLKLTFSHFLTELVNLVQKYKPFHQEYIPPPNISVPIFMDKEYACASCGTRLTGKGDVVFSCPGCGAKMLGRCAQCRDQSVEFACPDCGYAGP